MLIFARVFFYIVFYCIIFIFSLNFLYSKEDSFLSDHASSFGFPTWEIDPVFSSSLLSNNRNRSLLWTNRLQLVFDVFFTEDAILSTGGFAAVAYAPRLRNADSVNVFSYDTNIDRLFFKLRGVYYNVTLGRQNFLFGQGLVLDNISDGVDFNFQMYGFQVNTFVHYTGLLNTIKRGLNSFAKSFQEQTTQSKRVFAGGKIAYTFLNNTLYLSFLQQLDLTEYTQNFSHSFESQYVSLGLSSILFRELFLQFELVYQMGQMPVFVLQNPLTIDVRKVHLDVSAFATSTKLYYYTRTAYILHFVLQHSFASGSAKSLISEVPYQDRSFSGFWGFSRYNTGFVFQPNFRNLHFLSLHTGIKPLRSLYTAVKYVVYFKHFAEGAINFETRREGVFLGQAFEAQVNWDIFSDLTLRSLLGIFLKNKELKNLPGVSYSLFFSLEIKI